MRLISTCCFTAVTFAVAAFAADTQPEALHNFEKVSDSLYRGAQPSDEGFRQLAKLGVQTVLDLRGAGGRSSHEAEVVRNLGMKYVNVPFDGFAAPTPQEISKVLALIQDAGSGPVFVHCRRGADRTGTVVAVYRIEHDHWQNQRALDEAKSMKMAGAERLMQRFVMQYTAADSPKAAN